MLPEERCLANLALLDVATPDLAGALRAMPMTNVVLMPHISGSLTGQAWDVATQAWVPLSGDDPAGEAERDAEAMYTSHMRVFCLFGLGLGYFAAAFARRLQPYQRLAIFEVSPSCAKAALYTVDWAPLVAQGKRIDLYIGDALQSAIERFWLSLDTNEKLAIATPMQGGQVAGHCVKEYQQLLDQSIELMRHHAVGMATWEQFGGVLGRNDYVNIPEYLAHPGIDALKDVWAGRPAICLAAGPSLPDAVRQLMTSGRRDEFCVLTVGTVYAAVHALGLAPDIVTTIDFQRLNFTDQFQHVPLDPATALVYLHSTSPETIRRWPGPRFVGQNASDTTTWLRQYTEPKLDVSQVQTVAHLNLLTALEMGADPILLVGQDLAMPATEHHAVGARAQDLAPHEAPESFVDMPGIGGTTVHTRHSFLTMRTTFERLAAQSPDRRMWNCTPWGLEIRGMRHVALSDALHEIPRSSSALPSARALAAQRFFEAKPFVHWDAVTSAMDLRLTEASELAEWASSYMHRFEAIDEQAPMTARIDAYRSLLAEEPYLQARNQTFQFFAIRRFDIIKTLAEIPPNATTMAEEDFAEYNAERMYHLARLVTEEYHDVHDTFRTTLRRVLDVYNECQSHGKLTLSEALVLLARQQFHLVARLLASGRHELAPGHLAWLQTKLDWHMQRYDAVLARAVAGEPSAQRRQARAHAYLTQYWRTHATVAPRYWESLTYGRVPAIAPAYGLVAHI